MDRPPTPIPLEGAAQDIVFCHECENEWCRQQHGLTCPECGSEFTEIIEESQDPRANHLADSDDEGGHPTFPRLDSPRDSMPPLHSLHHHNPWQDAPDPAEDDLGQFQMRRNGPGSFTLSGSFVRNLGGNRGPQGQDSISNNFVNMLQGILGNNAGLANPHPGMRDHGRPPPIPPRPDDFHSMGNNQGRGTGFQHHRPNNFGGGLPYTYVNTGPNHRFQYSSSSRIFPRDANNPQPHVEPVDDLHAMLQTIFSPHGNSMFAGGGPAGTHYRNQQGQNPLPPNPLLGLLGHLLAPNGAPGDYVSSQEQLDRIISQLMEQNATGSAPGPASSSAIAALPKRTVDEKMLGLEGKAECSICMDDVNIGEEVTELPCGHWFHESCVGAWLSEHDTCPHCRKGISSTARDASSAPPTPHGGAGGSRSPGMRSYSSTPPSRNMPGAFGDSPPSFLAGSGTRSSPFRIDGSPSNIRTLSHQDHSGQQGIREPSNPSSPTEGTNNEGGGFTNFLRRGLFGPRRHSGGNGGGNSH